jgi:hypothetical protein
VSPHNRESDHKSMDLLESGVDRELRDRSKRQWIARSRVLIGWAKITPYCQKG